MKLSNCYIKVYHATMPIVAIVALALSATACGSEKSDEEIAAEEVHRQNRYELIENTAEMYSNKILSMPAEGMAVEELLMNINSRCHALLEQGDTMTALYFRQLIEETVRTRNNEHADLVFSKRPYSAFTIED